MIATVLAKLLLKWMVLQLSIVGWLGGEILSMDFEPSYKGCLYLGGGP